MIRAAVVGDVAKIFEVRCAVRENHMSRAELAEAGITRESVAEMIAGGEYVAPVAEVDGEVGAFGMARVFDGYVFALFVRPDLEGRGLGSAVLARLEGGLRERWTKSAWLTTEGTAVRARGFYRARGWVEKETLPDGQVRCEKEL